MKNFKPKAWMLPQPVLIIGAQAEMSVHEIMEKVLNLWDETVRDDMDVPSTRIG